MSNGSCKQSFVVKKKLHPEEKNSWANSCHEPDIYKQALDLDLNPGTLDLIPKVICIFINSVLMLLLKCVDARRKSELFSSDCSFL